MILLLAVSFVILLVIGMPIAFALVAAAWVALVFGTSFSPEILVQRMIGGVDSFPLVAIPLFIFAGFIMGKGGMSRRLIAFAQVLVGRLPAGLALVMVMASMLFAAISGSTAATTATIGGVMIPALSRWRGFDLPGAAALQTTAGCIGVIIPPSVPLILMGVVAGISVGDLFLAGILPGILMGLSLMAMSLLYSLFRRGGVAGEETIDVEKTSSWGRAAAGAVLPLMTLVIILGGIVGGVFTPTEAGVVAVIYSLVVCVAVYRELRIGEIPALLRETAIVTAVVVLCIAAAAPFAWLLTVQQVPRDVAEAMLAFTDNPVALVGMMVVVLLLVGTFLDLTPAMLILVPVFLPIARETGMPDLQFGLLVTMALAIGQCTPPVGISLFVACGVAKCEIADLVRPLLPFLAALVVALLLTAFFPFFSTWLPGLLSK